MSQVPMNPPEVTRVSGPCPGCFRTGILLKCSDCRRCAYCLGTGGHTQGCQVTELPTPDQLRVLDELRQPLISMHEDTALEATRYCLRCGWVPVEGMEEYLTIHGETASCIRCKDPLPSRSDPWDLRPSTRVE